MLGDRDPLMPRPARVREVGQTDDHVLVVVIEGAAHAINFSHPGELAHVIRLFMADKPIVDDPDSPGHANASRSTAATACPGRPERGSSGPVARGRGVASGTVGVSCAAGWLGVG